MRSIPLGVLFLLLLLICNASLAEARKKGPLHIRSIDDESSRPVPAHIKLRTVAAASQALPMADTNADGIYTEKDYDCEVGGGVSFFASAISMRYYRENTWVQCQHDEILFRFYRSTVADALDDFQKADWSKFASDSLEIYMLHKFTLSYIDLGDDKKVAVSAALLSESLMKANYTSLAVASEAVSLAATGRSIGYDDPIYFNALAKKYEFKKDVSDALYAFQEENDIKPSGLPDFRTLNKISGNFGDELLREFK